MRTKCEIALITLAVACIFMAPALSMPFNREAPSSKHPGMEFLPNNLTKDEMNNMTLGELQKIMQESRVNETGHFKNRTQEGCDEDCHRMDRSESMRNDSSQRKFDRVCPMAKGSLMLLIMDDLNADDLGNMTLNQIKELKEQKMDALYNMTPNEINAIKEKRILEQNNMTLGEVRAQNHELIQLARLLGFDPSNDCAKDEAMPFRGKESCGFGQMNHDEAVSRR